MKRNQYFDHNHSQKALSCRYNMDTNRVEAQFNDGTIVNSHYCNNRLLLP